MNDYQNKVQTITSISYFWSGIKMKTVGIIVKDMHNTINLYRGCQFPNDICNQMSTLKH